MRKINICFVLVLCFLSFVSVYAQRYEKVPFGDFEQWTVRYIKESGLIGGETRPIYMVAPKDTIYEAKPFDFSKTIWAGSNAYAVVAGITKANCSVWPDKGPTGTCAKLETVMVVCKAIGIVNIKALAAGSVFWGKNLEPITGTKNPLSFMDWGIPFTKKPVAVVMDYKALIPNTGKIIGKNNKEIDGYDPAQVMMILQYRWEDENGNVHAKRVGTCYARIEKSTKSWVKDGRFEIVYGDARKSAGYKDYMDLKTGEETLYTINSKGKKTQIIEEGWADASSPVTHALLNISSGSCKALTGALGNTLWIDNIRLEY